MRKILLAFCLFLLSQIIIAQEIRPLSTKSEISILTMGPGNYLYDKFGHSAIRVQDPMQMLDIVFNYGTYDFDTPNFYGKFAAGKLDYILSVNNYQDIQTYYIGEDRSITEQYLNLNTNQKSELYNLLIENAKPQNRAYLYNFTHDNCATRIRDIMQLALGEDLVYTTKTENPKSFRELIQENLHYNTWGSLGIDLALGAVVDKKATKWEEQFLPTYVFEANTSASISEKAIVKSTEQIYTQKENKKTADFFLISPLFILILISTTIIFFTIKDKNNKSRTKAIDISIFLFTGVVGLLLAFLWFGTAHEATKLNYNILWAFPISLAFIKLIAKDEYNKRLSSYLKLLCIMLALIGFHWVFGVQSYPILILPLLIALFYRYVYLIGYYNKLPREEA